METDKNLYVGKRVYVGGRLNGFFGTYVGRRVDEDGMLWYQVKDEDGCVTDWGLEEIKTPHVRVVYE